MSGKTISNLSVGLFGDASQFAHEFGTRATESVQKFGDSIKEVGSRLLDFTGIGSVIGGVAGSLFEFSKGFKSAANFESAEVSIGTMLHSAQQGHEVLMSLREFATGNGLEFPGLAENAKQLVAMGIAGDQVVPTLKMMSDIASGTGKPLETIVELYTRIRTEGTLGSREMLEFTNAGIPIAQALADAMGKSKEQVQQLIAAGKIGFPEVQKAFIGLTDKGGEFYDLTAKQAGTLGGVFRVMQGTMEDVFQDIAKQISTSFNLKGVMGDVAEFGKGAGTLLVDGVKAIAPAVEEIASLFSTAFNFLEEHAGAVKAALVGVGVVLGAIALPVVFTTIGTALAAVGAALASPIGIAIALGAGIAELANHFGFLDPAIRGFKNVCAEAFGFLQTTVPPIMASVWGAVQTAWSNIYNFVAPIVGSIRDWVVSNWSSMLAGVVAVSESIFDAVSAAFTAVWDVTKTIFGAIAEAAVATWHGMVEAFDWGCSLVLGRTVTAGQGITSVWNGIQEGAVWLKNTVVESFQAIAFSITHWEDVLWAVFFRVAAWDSDMVDRFEYFGEAVIYSIEYAYRNWRDILTDLMSLTKVVFTNVAGNVVSIFKNLSGLISGSVNLEDVWRPLTDGFKSSIKEAFKLPAFDNSASTKSLYDVADSMRDSLLTSFSATIAVENVKSKSDAKSLDGWIKGIFGTDSKPIVPIIKIADMPKTIGAVKIDPLKPMTLPVKVHMEGAGKTGGGDKIVQWGSAESERLNYMLSQESSRLPVPGTPVGFGGPSNPYAGVFPPKGDPKGPGTNNDYLYQIWQNGKPGNVAVANF